MRLDGAKAVVTGAGGGLGRWFCKRMCENGAVVYATDRDHEALEKTRELIMSTPTSGSLHLHVADVTNEEDVAKLFAEARQNMRGCNVLINSAGLLRDAMLVKKDENTGRGVKTASLSDWNAVIAVNLTGAFLCAREFSAAAIGTEKEAVVVNIASAARHGGISQGSYSASKAGLAVDTVVWGRELAKHNIRVGAVAPGAVETEMLKGLSPKRMEQLKSIIPLRRLATPDDVWMGVRFVIECDYFTARVLDVDGGLQL